MSLVCPAGTACPISNLAALGLPEVLLWVLSFAVIFGVLIELKIFKRAPAALISIATAFFVLMAAPAAAIAVIATMSTSMIIVAIGLIVLMALLFAAGGVTYQGPIAYYLKHSLWIAIAIIVIVALTFVGSGGLALIGLSTLPVLTFVGSIPWFLVIVGLAIIWMIYESKEPEPQTKPATQTK